MTNDEILKALYADMQEVKTKVGEIDEIKIEIKGLKEDVSGLKEDVSTLKEDVSGLKEDVCALKEDVCALKTDMHEVKEKINEINTLKNSIHKIGMQIENQIIPDIQLLVEGHGSLVQKLSKISSTADICDLNNYNIKLINRDLKIVKEKLHII